MRSTRDDGADSLKVEANGDSTAAQTLGFNDAKHKTGFFGSAPVLSGAGVFPSGVCANAAARSAAQAQLHRGKSAFASSLRAQATSILQLHNSPFFRVGVRSHVFLCPGAPAATQNDNKSRLQYPGRFCQESIRRLDRVRRAETRSLLSAYPGFFI